MATKKENTEATPLTEEQLIQKENDLQTKSEKLDQDIKEFEAFQETVYQEKEKLAEEKEAFESEKQEFELQKEIFEKAKKEFELEKTSFIKGNEEAKPEETSPVELEFDEEGYQFTPDAPKSIRINGKPYTQQEIAENEDLKLQLIGGKSSLIIKKH